MIKRAVTAAWIAAIGWTVFVPSAQAQQVIPDGTMNTSVTRSLDNFIITNGTTSGTNLFHSFHEFSIPTGGAAIFNNAPNIQNIFSRVTGGMVSNIDGVIRANGMANLFLLNPSGILFGPNAALNIGGSFVGTTANSVQFTDGMEFSTTNLSGPPLLTISVPIGLQMGTNPGAIAVRTNPGLSVTPTQTLALVGGDVTLTNGRITVPSAHVELGSVSNGIVGISPTWQFDYAATQPTRSVSLAQGSRIVTSGVNGGGDVHVLGQNLFVTGGSRIDTSSISSQPGGDINVQVTEEILLDRQTASGTTGFLAEVANGASGQGGSIILGSQSLRILNGARISLNTRGNGDAGQLNITTDRLVVDARNSSISGLITAQVTSTGRGTGGDIRIQSNQLRLLNGAQISVSTNGVGNGGRITITAQDVQVEGVRPGTTTSSGIFANVNTDAQGQGGDITIHTDQLRILNGGEITSNTSSSGNAGNINILSKAILLDRGTSSTTAVQSRVSSVDAAGNAGVLTIQTDSLRVLNGAQITVSTVGKGNSGSIRLNAEDIDLNGNIPSSTAPGGVASSGIFATVNSDALGKGGEIRIDSGQLRILNGARINGSTSGVGNAGNLNIAAKRVEIDRGKTAVNTGILADVFLSGQGNGGDIHLQTQQLSIINGGNISATTAGLGKGGDIAISANQITLQNSGAIRSQSDSSGSGGRLTINTQHLDLDQNASLSTAATSTGQSGNLNLQTQRTSLRNGSRIMTNSTGTGDGGTITLTGESLTLQNDAAINASTASGHGGNLNLNLSGLLYLRDLSQLNAEAGGTGNGGNITLSAPFIIGLGNSDIIANAFQGRGGNIQITTDGILGLASRNTLTPREDPTNDITASSQFNLNGSVQINNISIAPYSGLVNLPVDLIDVSQQIDKSCTANQEGSFVITGRGGMPTDPTRPFGATLIWSDFRSIVPANPTVVTQPNPTPPIVEATTLAKNPITGQVELLAAQPVGSSAIATCALTRHLEFHGYPFKAGQNQRDSTPVSRVKWIPSYTVRDEPGGLAWSAGAPQSPLSATASPP